MSNFSLSRPDGGAVSAYVAEPANTAVGAVVVIHEWWGLNGHIQSVCDKIAAQGFVALAPDLYHGVVVSSAEEAGKMMNGLDFGQAVSQDLAASVAELRRRGLKVGVLGFCMGGALTLLSAVHLSPDAAVCFYGIPPAGAADMSSIKCPLLGHFAQHDYWVTPARVQELQTALDEGHVAATLHSYDADHAFCNDTRPEVFHAANAQLAWERSFAFLQEQLHP